MPSHSMATKNHNKEGLVDLAVEEVDFMVAEAVRETEREVLEVGAEVLLQDPQELVALRHAPLLETKTATEVILNTF